MAAASRHIAHSPLCQKAARSCKWPFQNTRQLEHRAKVTQAVGGAQGGTTGRVVLGDRVEVMWGGGWGGVQARAAAAQRLCFLQCATTTVCGFNDHRQHLRVCFLWEKHKKQNLMIWNQVAVK